MNKKYFCSMTERQQKLKESWKQAIFSAVTATITVFVLFAFTQSGDEKKEVKNELQKLNINKAGIDYVDKQDKAIKDEFNSKLDIIIQNQHEANNLLKEISTRK